MQFLRRDWRLKSLQFTLSRRDFLCWRPTCGMDESPPWGIKWSGPDDVKSSLCALSFSSALTVLERRFPNPIGGFAK